MLHLTNWVGEQPYFICKGSARHAIVVSIRGTMSVQDCITDCMYKPVLLNADVIGLPHLSGCQLHCHAGVVTATSFILSDLENHGILHRLLLGKYMFTRVQTRAQNIGIEMMCSDPNDLAGIKGGHLYCVATLWGRSGNCTFTPFTPDISFCSGLGYRTPRRALIR